MNYNLLIYVEENFMALNFTKEAISQNTIKITDKKNDVIYVESNFNEIYVFDENKKLLFVDFLEKGKFLNIKDYKKEVGIGKNE